MMTQKEKKILLLMGTAPQITQLLSQSARIGKALGFGFKKSIDTVLDDLKDYRKSNKFNELLKALESEDKQ